MTMDKELLERLAREAGFDVEDGEIVLDRVLATGDAPDQRSELQRFASLIAEECAKVVEDVLAYNEDDPAETFAAAIREKFRSTT